MLKITFIVLAAAMVQAGFSGAHLAYNAGFRSPQSFGAEHPYDNTYGASYDASYGASYDAPYGASYGAPYATPLPVAPLSGHHPYPAVGYSAPPIVKFRSNGGGFDCSPFTSYASVRSHHKFAFPAPVPAVYNTPPRVNFGSPAVSYSGYEAPNTVLKFGPPITTTTTTYSTVAAAARAPVGNPLNAANGW